MRLVDRTEGDRGNRPSDGGRVNLQVLGSCDSEEKHLQDSDGRKYQERVDERLDELQPAMDAAPENKIRMLTRCSLILRLLNLLSKSLRIFETDRLTSEEILAYVLQEDVGEFIN